MLRIKRGEGGGRKERDERERIEQEERDRERIGRERRQESKRAWKGEKRECEQTQTLM